MRTCLKRIRKYLHAISFFPLLYEIVYTLFEQHFVHCNDITVYGGVTGLFHDPQPHPPVFFTKIRFYRIKDFRYIIVENKQAE